MKRVSFGIVIAALLVSAPRLTLAFLIGDGILVAKSVEIGILTVTGIGSGVVLTIGNAVLAHALAVKATQRSWLWWIEAIAWLLYLVGAVILVAPTLVAGLGHSPLGTVLSTPRAAWLWAITAVVIVELLVGAAMAAAILASAPVVATPVTVTKPSFATRVGEAVVRKLESSLAPPAQEGEDTEPRDDEEDREGMLLGKPSKQQVFDTMLAIYQHNPKASLRVVGQQIGRTPQTVSNYLSELEQQGKVRVNPQGVQVVPSS